MAQAQLRMTALFHVRLWSTPVLTQEQRETSLSSFEIALVGIQRPQHFVRNNSLIKVVHKRHEK
jgi:hypothetical protein